MSLIAKALGAVGAWALGAGLSYVALAVFVLAVALRAMHRIEEAAAEARVFE